VVVMFDRIGSTYPGHHDAVATFTGLRQCQEQHMVAVHDGITQGPPNQHLCSTGSCWWGAEPGGD
jgi:hypothetical protein